MRLSARRPRPGLAIAAVALLATAGGGAYAATQLPKNSVGIKQLRRNSVVSSKVKNHSLKAGDFKPGQLPAGPAGATGPRGSVGATGPAGPFPAALPAGKTLRGTFAISGTAGGAADTADAAETFAFPLGAAPVAHVIPAGAMPPAECPGSTAAPAAAAGHLCVFEAERSATVSSLTVFDPAVNLADGAGKADKFGFGVRATANAAGALRSGGTWAVTGG